MLNLALTDAKW